MEIEENSSISDIDEELIRIEQFYCQNDQDLGAEQQVILNEQEVYNIIQYNLENSFYQQSEDQNFNQTIREFSKFVQKDLKSENSSINLLSVQEFQDECRQEEKKGFQKVASNLKNNLTKILMKNQLAFLHFLIVFIRIKKLDNVCFCFQNFLINYTQQTQWIVFLDFHESKIVFDLFRSQIDSVQIPHQIFFFSSLESYPTQEQIHIVEFYFQKRHSWKEELQFFKFTKFDISNKIFDILNNLNNLEDLLQKNQNTLEKNILEKIIKETDYLAAYKQICQDYQDLDYQQRDTKFEEFLKNQIKQLFHNINFSKQFLASKIDQQIVYQLQMKSIFNKNVCLLLFLLVEVARTDFKNEFTDFMKITEKQNNVKVIIRPIQKNLRSISFEVKEKGIIYHLDIIQVSKKDTPEDDSNPNIVYNNEVLTAYKNLKNTLNAHQINKNTIYPKKDKQNQILQNLIQFQDKLGGFQCQSITISCLETKQTNDIENKIEKCQIKKDEFMYKTVLNDIIKQENPLELYVYKFNDYQNLNQLIKYQKGKKNSFVHKIIWKLNAILEIAFQIRELKLNGWIDRGINLQSFYYRQRNVQEINEYDSISMINTDFIISKKAYSENAYLTDIYALGNVFNQVLFGLDQEIEFLDFDISTTQKTELMQNLRENLQIYRFEAEDKDLDLDFDFFTEMITRLMINLFNHPKDIELIIAKIIWVMQLYSSNIYYLMQIYGDDQEFIDVLELQDIDKFYQNKFKYLKDKIKSDAQLKHQVYQILQKLADNNIISLKHVTQDQNLAKEIDKYLDEDYTEDMLIQIIISKIKFYNLFIFMEYFKDKENFYQIFIASSLLVLVVELIDRVIKWYKKRNIEQKEDMIVLYGKIIGQNKYISILVNLLFVFCLLYYKHISNNSKLRRIIYLQFIKFLLHSCVAQRPRRMPDFRYERVRLIQKHWRNYCIFYLLDVITVVYCIYLIQEQLIL